MDESDLCSGVVMGLQMHLVPMFQADLKTCWSWLFWVLYFGRVGFQSGALGRRQRLRIWVREVSEYVFMILLVYSQLK